MVRRAMRPSAALVPSLAALALAGAAGGGHSGLSVSVGSAIVRPGDRVVVQVAGAVPKRRLHVGLQVYPPVGAGARPVAVGSVVPDRRGRARLVFRLPHLGAAAYRPAAQLGSRVVPGHGLLSVAALPPRGFGPLGAPGCAPPSPSSGRDIFGTAAGAELWALPFAAAGEGGAANMVGVLGKETKIVFKMTSGIPQVFYAVAPDGARLPPVWMTPHTGSNWERPGAEWGAGFVFDRTGCWRIHAGTAPWSGDLWLSVLS